MRRFLLPLLLALGTASVLLAQATPPARVNYQGALRSGLGVPENGDRDVILHLYDAAAAGSEILKDSHTTACLLGAETQEVTVTAGLFNVHLGGGCVEDGAGVFAVAYDSLEKVFRDFSDVYLEVEVRVGAAGGAGAYETLSPRTRIVSAAFSLNANHLQGKPAAEFIDTTSNQSKSGQLTLSGGILGLGAATLSEAQVGTLTGGAASVADALHTHTLVSGAAVAASAELLDGLDSTAFLRKNASDTFVGPGTLSFAAATQLLGDAGTAALPGIAFSGDADTGIYHPASNAVSIAAGGSDA